MVHLAALSYSDQLLESSTTNPLAAIRIIMRMMLIMIMTMMMMMMMMMMIRNEDDDLRHVTMLRMVASNWTIFPKLDGNLQTLVIVVILVILAIWRHW